MQFSYFIPTKILFGPGTVKTLHEHPLPGKKALIVTSAGRSMKAFGYLETVQRELAEAGVDSVLFDKILPNPIADHVMEGAALAKQEGCDFVLGLGGGSSIDSAKSIAVMAVNEGHYWDYIDGGSGKGKAPANDPLPVVAVTTTAGTGTEADPWTVITHNQEKIGFGYDKTYPALSVVDPELMVSVPPHLTAYQGFDALFHSTEGYINVTANEISDLYAYRSIELIGKSLAAAIENGQDISARTDVAMANTLAGMVESVSGCTAEHSIEHAMSAFHPELPHGAGLIMVSCAYYTYVARSGVCEDRMVRMAKALGKQDAACAMDFVAALEQLQKACGVANLKMSDYGITESELDTIAQNALDTMGGLFAVDPCLKEKDAVVQILKESYC